LPLSAKKEVIWVVGATGISTATMLIIFLLLARFTSPEVLGQLAIINIVLGLAFTLQDMGLSSYFIHRQSLSNEERSTLYFVNVIFGVLACIIVVAISFPIGYFYKSEAIVNGLLLVSLNFVLISLSAQYQASFIKDLKSNVIAKIDIITRGFLLIVASILIAYFDMGLRGYLYGLLVSYILRYCLFLWISPKSYHPRFNLSVAVIKPALTFGCFQMGSQLVNQLRSQADQLIIGKVIGMGELGIYSLAKEIILKPLRFTGPIISRIAQPRFAKIQDDILALNAMFLKISKLILVFNTLIFALVALILWFAIPVLFGEEYEAAFPIFLILILVGIVRPLGSILGALSQAKGNSKLEFTWNVLASFVAVVALFIAIPVGTLYSFAVATASSQALLTLISLSYFSKGLGELQVAPLQKIIVVISVVYFVSLYFALR
jgi:exopolysaccharide (amylovoran) exporter